MILDVLTTGKHAGQLHIVRPNTPTLTYGSACMSRASASPLLTQFPLTAANVTVEGAAVALGPFAAGTRERVSVSEESTQPALDALSSDGAAV